MCMFCRSLFVLLYFFFWTLYCLFFDIRILNTPLVSNKLFLKVRVNNYSKINNTNNYITPQIKEFLLMYFFYVHLIHFYNCLLPGKSTVVFTREKSTKKRKRKKSMKRLKRRVKVQDMSLKSKYRSQIITKPI